MGEKLSENIIITAALPYSNGKPHLGHLASTYLPSDIFARYCRLIGKNVVFACGGDDYGTPILIAAEKEGKKPEEYIEFWHKQQKKAFDSVKISFDIYYQTHSPENIQLTQHFFKKIYEKGHIYKKEIEQFYCEKDKKFLPDRYVIGTCPFCGAENQYGDGCEVCGKTYDPIQLKDPKCAICGKKPVIKKSLHYFFKLSAFSQDLKKWLLSNKNLQSEIKNYVLKWIEEGLKDWDITRDISWGVPIPLEEAKDKVLYGWFDNHLGYISFVLKYCKDKGIDGKSFWNSSTIYHFIGKDIVYHHYLFLPAERIAEGTFKLPDFIPTRGHLLLEGKKFSKSRKWYISIEDFLKDFPSDYLRYYLASLAIQGQKDASFSWKEFQSKINNELVDIIGNLIHRVLTFIWNFFDGKLPSPKNFDNLDKQFEEDIQNFEKEYHERMKNLEFNKALKKILEFSIKANQYFQHKEPWKTKDENCIHLGFKATKLLVTFLHPFVPDSSEELWKILNFNFPIYESLKNHEIKDHVIKKPYIVFKKVDKQKINKKLEELSMSQQEISYKDFKKVEMKVGKIIDVIEIPKSKNLYKLIVDFGNEKRQAISGIKNHYKPEELIGKKFVFVTNLEKKKFMGEESQCMILAAEDEKGNISLIAPVKEVEEGSKIL